MAIDQDSASLDDLLRLVKLVCTKEQVQGLLRQAKDIGEKPVRVSGNFDAVALHLRDAIQTEVVTKQSVYELVGEAEENGNQHIFYFKPKSDRTLETCNDVERVAASILGAEWQSDRRFPRYFINPSGEEWADFRTTRMDESGKSDWVAKLYSGTIRQKLIDTRKEGPNRIAKIYEETPSREVFMARWHHFGLLELRVPLEKTHKLLIGSVQRLWRVIEPAISSEDFEPFDLMGACRRIIDQDDDHKDLYRLGDAHFLDQTGGLTRITPRSGDHHLKQDRARREAVKLFEECRLLVVVWFLTDKDHGTKDELRSVIGKFRQNEVTMISKTTARAVMHVTHQLRRFAG